MSSSADMTGPPASAGDKPGPLVLGRWSFWVLMVGVVTGLAGLLFGYDQGVISGALSFIKKDFDLSDEMVEVVTSWVAIGAMFGALFAGTLADRVGRRRAGMLAGVLFAVGAILQGLAPDTPVLVLGRLVVGLGVGVASVAAPLYAAEMAPTAVRGRMISTYQLAITIGIFVAYLVDAALDHTGDWRLMLAIAAVPGVALIAGMAGAALATRPGAANRRSRRQTRWRPSSTRSRPTWIPKRSHRGGRCSAAPIVVPSGSGSGSLCSSR